MHRCFLWSFRKDLGALRVGKGRIPLVLFSRRALRLDMFQDPRCAGWRKVNALDCARSDGSSFDRDDRDRSQTNAKLSEPERLLTVHQAWNVNGFFPVRESSNIKSRKFLKPWSNSKRSASELFAGLSSPGKKYPRANRPYC